MALHHRLLAAAYPFVKLKKYIENIHFLHSRNQLRILLYHDIPPYQLKAFESQLRRVQKKWKFITPGDFVKIRNGEMTVKGKNVMLTFDDGFISNREAAERVLSPLGIKAIFFVVHDFIDITDGEMARQYVSDHINPMLSVIQIPEHCTNMNWSDLEFLLEQGHTIGAHTKTHARLSEIHDENQLVHEITESADLLEMKLGISIDHFAFPFGNLASFSASALKISTERFAFVYSGLRGDNSGKSGHRVFMRDSLTPEDPNALIGSFLEGAADFQYRKSHRIIDSWISGTTPGSGKKSECNLS